MRYFRFIQGLIGIGMLTFGLLAYGDNANQPLGRLFFSPEQRHHAQPDAELETDEPKSSIQGRITNQHTGEHIIWTETGMQFHPQGSAANSMTTRPELHIHHHPAVSPKQQP